MTDEQKECALWLMMEYDAHLNRLNGEGFYHLISFRDKWNIEKARKCMLEEVCDEVEEKAETKESSK